MDGGEQANVQLDDGLERTRKVLKRLKFKGDGSDPLTVALNQNIVEGERAKAQNTDKMDILHEALNLADAYDYEVDPPAPASMAPRYTFQDFAGNNGPFGLQY